MKLIAEIAKEAGTSPNTVIKYARKTGVLGTTENGLYGVQDNDVEGLIAVVREAKASASGGWPMGKPRGPRKKPATHEQHVAEHKAALVTPQMDFHATVRKLIHLMKKLNIDSLEINDGKATFARTVEEVIEA